jgi:F1F0 ATPase subunit 2
MNVFHLSIALTAGLVLGAFYFWALWLTVQRLPGARRPWLLSLASFWIRLLVTLSGFYFVAQGRVENLALCLLSFFFMRRFLVRRYQPGPSVPA